MMNLPSLSPTRHTDDKVNQFFELSLDMLCIANTDGYFKQLNPAFTRVLEWDIEELLERPFWEFIHPDDTSATQQEIEKLAKGIETINFEHRFRTKYGTYKWLSWAAHPTPDGFLYAVAHDITALKEAILRVSEREERTRLLYQITTQVSKDIDEQLQESLSLTKTLLGLDIAIISQIEEDVYTVEYFDAPEGALTQKQMFNLGDTYCSIVLQANTIITINHMERSPHRQHPCYNIFHLESYIGIPVYVQGKQYGTLNFSSPKPRQTPFTQADIDFIQLLGQWVGASLERKLSREVFNKQTAELQEAQQFLNSVIENLPVMLFMKEAKTLRFVTWNKAAEEITGLDRHMVLGKNDHDFFPPEQADFFTNKDRQVLSGKRIVEIPQEPIQVAGKGQRWLFTRKIPLLDNEGDSKYLLGVSLDITDRLDNEVVLTKRAAELEILTKVSAVMAQTANAEQLLQEVLDLSKESFGLYHTQIYELNDVGDELILTVGSGEAGRQMVNQKRTISMSNEQSLVARAAHLRQGVIENDLQAAPTYLPNPLLPDARASLSIPLIVSDTVLGVLNAQSDQVDHFTDEDIRIHSTLATQIASALQASRSYTRSERVLAELNALNRRLTHEGWADYLNTAPSEFRYQYDLRQLKPVGDTSPANITMTQSLQIRGENIGRLQLVQPQVLPNRVSHITSAVAERLSTHIENLRLAEQTQKRASELETVAQVSVTASTELNTNKLLQTVVDLTQTRFALYHVHIYLLDKTAETLTLAAGAGQTGRQMVADGWSIPLNRQQSLVARTARTRQTVLVNNIHTDPEFLPNAHLVDTQAEMALPLIAGDNLLGVLDIQSNKPHSFSNEDQRIYTTLAAQVSVALQNAQQYQQTQTALAESERQARQLATLNNISERIVTASNLEQVYEIVAEETVQLFSADRVTLSLLDDTGLYAQVIAIGGEKGAIPIGIPQPISGSWVEKAINSRRAVIIHDPSPDPSHFIQSSMVVPLVTSNGIIGTINIGSKKLNIYDDQDESLTFQLASLISAAVENHTLLAEQRAAVKRLQELDQLKSDFLANMSHELRTPLNSIIGFTDVMLEGLNGPLNELMEGDLKVIRHNGHHLLNLISEILDMAKIESGRMELELEYFNLQDMVEDVITTVAPLAREKGLNLELISSNQKLEQFDIEADPKRMKQVLLNLVSNAIKFTQTGSVKVGLERRASRISLWVQDTGMGITPTHHDIIFEAFRQVDTSATRKVGGTGLGLAISRKLIESHGGNLWVESTGVPGEGSTFFIDIPVGKVAYTVGEKSDESNHYLY